MGYLVVSVEVGLGRKVPIFLKSLFFPKGNIFKFLYLELSLNVKEFNALFYSWYCTPNPRGKNIFIKSFK